MRKELNDYVECMRRIRELSYLIKEERGRIYSESFRQLTKIG